MTKVVAPIAKKVVAKKTEEATWLFPTSVVNKASAAPVVMKASTMKVAETKIKPAAAKKKVGKHMLEEHYHIVETAAYYIAERHGFHGLYDGALGLC